VFAVVSFGFDSTISPFGLTVRLETLALAGVVFVMLLMAAFGAARMPIREPAESDEGVRPPRLRRDDLLLIGFGAVPGAILGARIDYGLIHYDYFSQDWNRLLDPGQGGLALTLGVVLGALSAAMVAALLSAPVSRWLHVAAVPLLLGLGLGKLAMVLGADGQGRFETGSWASVFTGSGPWQSANADVPALASQVVEGMLVLAAAVAVVAIPFLLRFRIRRWRRFIRPGFAPAPELGMLTGARRFFTVICVWAAIRFAVASSWRDATVFGSLNAEQVILVFVLALFVVLDVLAWLLAIYRRHKAARPRTPVQPADDLPEPRFGPSSLQRGQSGQTR
jgi:prolipoprotein diacylglyceryltransferase